MCWEGRGQERGWSLDVGGAALGALRGVEWGLSVDGRLWRGSKGVVGRGPGGGSWKGGALGTGRTGEA